MKSKIVEINIKAPHTPSQDYTSHEELEIRVEAVLSMAKFVARNEGHSTAIHSIIIDAEKALKIIRRKRWWQIWK